MPLPKPKTGESESDFMRRCMGEAYGDDAPDDRTQEMAIAMCLDAFRSKANRPADEVKRIIKLWQKLLTTKQEPPDPLDYDDRDEFMSDCVDAIDDEEACAMLWSERSAADSIHRATHAETPRKAGSGWHFVLSDESEDRMGDVITAEGWRTEAFVRNPIALFAHDPSFIIGRWHDVKVNGTQLRGRLELAPEGTSPRIDEIRRLVEADILRAVSVGFRGTKKAPLTDKSDPFFGPFRFLEQELVECSLVAVPANANALAIAKSLRISTGTLGLVFAENRKENGTTRRNGATGEHAATSRNGKGSKIMSTLSERIAALQTDMVAKEDALMAHLAKMNDDDVSDEDLELTNTLNADIGKMRKRLEAWLASEKLLAKSTVNGNGSNGSSSRALTVLHDQRRPDDGDEGVSSPHIIAKRKKELAPLEYLVRAGTVAVRSKEWQIDPAKALEKIYGDDEVTKVACDLILRTATAPAMTTVPGWAQELAQQTYAELMPQLIPQAVYTRFAAKGLTLQFGRAAKIVIPTRSVTPTIAGSFVGEGMAIPVRIGAFTSQNLTPKKLAVITVWTREMDEHSTPAIEGVLREAIQTDTSVAIDSVLIDANPATNTRPAGLLNGVAAQTPTTGPGLPAIIGDLKLLVGVLTTSTKGNIRAPVWLMNPGEMLSASLANTNGIFPFKAEIGAGTLLNIPIIDSATIPTRTVILVDAADFVTAGGAGPRFELSDSATLHMEDTNPLELVGTGSPGTVASPQRSLFQTDSIALRMIMPLNWLMRRSGCVAWVNNVNW